MAIASETELYEPIKLHLEKLGYEVKAEVRSCDLVAKRADEDEPIIVELKKSFNLSLLFQGLARQKVSSRVYIAVEQIRGKRMPAHQKWTNIIELCQRLNLGLITVQFYKTKKPYVEILCHPEEMESGLVAGRRQRMTRKKKRLLQEFHERSGDYNIGGSSNTKLITAYRELALQCAMFIDLHGPLKLKQLREYTGKQKVNNIMQHNYYQWFERVAHGTYQLTPEGKKALKTYERVLHSSR